MPVTNMSALGMPIAPPTTSFSSSTTAKEGGGLAAATITSATAATTASSSSVGTGLLGPILRTGEEINHHESVKKR